MKSLKKMLCLVMAIAVVVGSLGLVTSIAAGAETDDAKYVLKFSKEVLDSAKLITLDDLRSANYFNEPETQTNEFVKSKAKAGMKVSMNEGSSSISLVKESVTDGEDYQYGTTLEVPLSDEMRENYLKATDNKMIIKFWLSNCQDTSVLYNGLYTDCQLRIYTKFKTPYQDADAENRERYIKISTLNKNSYRMNQQVKKTFKLVGPDGEALNNLDNVESIIFCLYNYKKNIQATMNISGIAYEGEPEVVKFVEPTPGEKKSYASFTDWQKFYLKSDFGNTPQTVKYYSEGGYDDTLYKSAKQAGWAYYNNTVEVREWQLNTVFDVDPVAFNQALATANQAGGEGKIKITCKYPKIEDTEGKSMQAEFQVRINTYDGKTHDLAQQFIEPGKEYTFEMSTRDIKYNSISGVRVALMAFWLYDPVDDVYYDTGKDQFAKRYDKNGNLMTPVYEDPNDTGTFKGYSIEGQEELLQDSDVVKITTACSDGRKDVVIKDSANDIDIIGRLKSRTMKNVECFISPLYTGEFGEDEVVTTTGGSETESTSMSEYEYAGEHFYDFTAQAYAETYGAYTHASFANYLFEDYYDSCEIVDYNLEKDGILQGFADRDNPLKKVDCSTDEEYKTEYQEAKGLASGGYQVELKSPYPRRQEQHQAAFAADAKWEDDRLMQDGTDHKGQKPQGETYSFQEQMSTALQHALDHPNPTQNGYLAVDVYIKDATHGYKNTYEKYKGSDKNTYLEWCKKNGKEAKNEKSPVQVIVAIGAKTADGTSLTAKVMEMIDYGVKKTLYIDVSEFTPDCTFQYVSIAAQNYSHLANREQGGDNLSCGITDVQVRYSALYIPGSANTDLTTTVDVTRPLDEEEAKKLKKMYDALPGLTVDDYETEEDYEKLSNFVKAWSKASKATQDYCEKEYGIDYAEIGMLEADVYEKIYGSGSDGDYYDDDDPYSSDTGDLAFPMVALLVAGLSGYVVLKTRKRKV